MNLLPARRLPATGLCASALVLVLAITATVVAVAPSAAPAATVLPTVTLSDPENWLGTEELPETVNYRLHATDSAGEPLTYAAAGLPPGVTLDTATGLLSGTVSMYYDGKVSITATDTSGASASVSFTWRAENWIDLAFPPVDRTPPSTAVTQNPHGRSSNPADPLTYTASGLPPGLSIAPATGVVSGTTTSAIGSYTVTVTAGDATGSSYSQTFTWNIWNTIIVTVTTGPQPTAGEPIVPLQATATDAAPGQQLTFGLQGAPAGVSIDPVTGVISGTPTRWALGGYALKVIVTDASGSQGTSSFEWVVRGKITVSNPGNETARVGQPALVAMKATDTAAADQLNYSMSGAPPGVSIDSLTGLIQGWPVTPGAYRTTIAAHGAYDSASTAKFTWTVNAVTSPGVTGAVKLGLAGKCLDDAGDKGAAGTKVQIRACDGTASQRWTYSADDTLRIHGQCLSVKGAPKAGSRLVLGQCAGSAGKRWLVTGHAELVNGAVALCAADPAASARNGTPVVLDHCGGLRRESWTLPPAHLMSPLPGECAAVSPSGDRIILQPCNGSKAEQWTAQPDGTIRLAAGKCLGATPVTAVYFDGAKAVLKPCGNGSDYTVQWSIVSSGIAQRLEFAGSSSCLAVPKATGANGIKVLQTASCADGLTQWHLG